MNFSTELYEQVLDVGLRYAISSPVMLIRSGTMPETADSAATGSLLCTVSLPYPMFAAAVDSTISLTGSWNGTVFGAGTAGWFRISPSGSSTGASTSIARIDGTIGTTGVEDLILTTTTLAVNDTIDVTAFKVQLNAALIGMAGTGTFA